MNDKIYINEVTKKTENNDRLVFEIYKQLKIYQEIILQIIHTFIIGTCNL